MKNKNLLFVTIMALFAVASANAQEGFGTNSPAPSSVIDMTATNKGALLPRVALTSITVAAPVATPADALTVFNTATAGTAPNNVIPGYYYWSTSDNRWIRLLNQSDAVEPWQVQGSATNATTNGQNIYQMGHVAVGINQIPSFSVGGTTINPAFHVEGDISTSGKMWTTSSVYADYVFEDYFNGFSKINNDYKFKSLKEVAVFIEENKHLPGVTPISEIAIGKSGYTIDLTQLSMQQLEKLEELYLHVIEQQAQLDVQLEKMESQQKVIDSQQKELDQLKEKLIKIESFLNK